MSLDQAHPELSAEQAYVDLAYACMERMHADVASFREHGRNDFEREAFDRWKAARMAALSDRFSPLVFGRIDRLDDETYYIGRQHIWGDGRSTVVIDWRAPVARAFYRASGRDPMELRRRRQYLLDARQVLGISDDDLSDGDRLRGGDILQIELRRQRTGQMRDIVATIQAEQDLIIRSPLEGICVVQGGPGTGKTAIGLHRASFLLYEHREHLSRHKVLVVGPNPTFMRYIAHVLPSLGETAVTQRTIEELAPLVRTDATDDRNAEHLKGDARMADVLACALALRAEPMTTDVALQVQGARLWLRADQVAAECARLKERRIPHRQGREMLRDALLLSLYRDYQRTIRAGSTAASFDDIVRQIRKDPGFRKSLDGVWPAVGTEALVRAVIGSKSQLARAAEGILTLDEQRQLVRAREKGWSHADRVLMDEARALIEGPPPRFGHVVVDEAQDLSPMRLRMLARRSRDGSMTVLGDLAQSTGAWARDDWGEVLRHLPGDARVEELTLGYRVSPAIMAVANAILAEAAPAIRPPVAVRAEPGEVSFVASPEDALPAAVARLARALSSEGTVAVIAPDALTGSIEDALSSAGIGFGDATREGLEQPLTVVPASLAKGLEFDAVLIVEPTAIVDQGGLRLLYIGVTRAMQRLVVVHARPLPPALERADGRQTA